METVELARTYAKHYVLNSPIPAEGRTGDVIVFYAEDWHNIEFHADEIREFEIEKGKARAFDKYSMALYHTKYDGFFIFDIEFNEVTDLWEKDNDN